jgi:tetratricopeptide (TPR) repeat protein
MAQPQHCTGAVFLPLSQGYEALRAGQDDQAWAEFEKVIKIDPYNPYALNNLAVLAEKQGKLKEAMAFLLDAETYAAEYLHKVDEICEGRGLCLAMVPSQQKGQTSSIASLIHGNINLLRTKIGKAPAPDK